MDWEKEPCTEPPLTIDMSLSSLQEAFSAPIILPKYPNHTQQVERLVRVVTEAATQRVGFTARHRLILQLLKSHSLVPKFNTKRHDSVI